jgi:hypothetical protein
MVSETSKETTEHGPLYERVTKSPSVWPSEASAKLYDQTESDIVGKCHRASFWRMTGETITNQTDAVGLRRFVTGRLLEESAIDLAKKAGIHVASGVRHYINDVEMSYELDLVVLDPETNIGYIIDYKTTYGYVSGKKIYSDGEPKWEAVMQVCLYINEIRTGKRLKEIILESLNKRQQLQQQATDASLTDMVEPVRLQAMASRYRTEVTVENLNKMSDGPLLGMLAYESRDDGQTRNFELSLKQDPIDGLTYPAIDGVVKQKFSIESIYERYKKLQGYYKQAIAWAEEQLKLENIIRPDEAHGPEADNFWYHIQKKLKSLPTSLLPPAEYEWKYPAHKVQSLGEAKIIGKVKYEAWKKDKGKKTFLGAWQCAYCPYKNRCVAMEYPEMRHLALDIMAEEAA